MSETRSSLLMHDATFATVVGKAVVGGFKCDHLAVAHPAVDRAVVSLRL